MYSLLVGTGLVLFFFTLRNADLAITYRLIRNLGWSALLIPVSEMVWTLAHAEAWRRILNLLGHRPSLASLTPALFTAESARQTFPAGPAVSESLAAVLLKQRFAIPYSDGVASLAIKKLLVVSTNAVYAIIGVALAWTSLAAASERMFGDATLLWLMVGGAAGIGITASALGWSLAKGSLAANVLRLLQAIPITALRRFLDARAAGFAATDRQLASPLRVKRRGLVIPALLLLAQWLLKSFETWLILWVLGCEVTLIDALAIEIAGTTLRSLAFAIPGGLGVQDAGYAAMLTAFASASAAAASAVATLPQDGASAVAAVAAAFIVLKRSKELCFIAVGWCLLLMARRRPPLPGSDPQADSP